MVIAAVDANAIKEMLILFGITSIKDLIPLVIVLGVLYIAGKLLCSAVKPGWLMEMRASSKKNKVKFNKSMAEYMKAKTLLDNSISEDILPNIRRELGCDRVTVWRYNNGKASINHRQSFDFQACHYQSVIRNGPSIIDGATETPTSATSQLTKYVFSGETTPRGYTDVETIETNDREILIKFGVKSFIVSPIITHGMPIGFMMCAWVYSKKECITSEDIVYVKEQTNIVNTKLEDIEALGKMM